jgi:uncharacterized protein (TIGR02001 family)
MSKLTRSLLVSLFALCIGSLMMAPAPPAKAQSVSVGADMVSRYVWRGTELGGDDVAHIQPSLSYSEGGFTIGSWGSFGLGNGAGGGNVGTELDLYASYAFDLGSSGSFSIGVTDYFFPSSSGEQGDFFNYAQADPSSGDSGAHVIEPNVSYTGPESFPISLFAGIYAINGFQDENPVWLEASYPFSVKEVDMSLAIGGTPYDKETEYTDGDTDAGLTKVSLSATKSIEITDSFSLPISGSYQFSPYFETSYFVFGISL